MTQLLKPESIEAMFARGQTASVHPGMSESARHADGAVLPFPHDEGQRKNGAHDEQAPDAHHDDQHTAMLHLQQRLLTLKLLPRTGWLQRGMQRAESIAEHTFGVATLALIIGDMVPDVDRGRLLAIALLHDMAEALIGDLPATASQLFGSAAKHDAERRAMIELFHFLPQGDEYLELWNEYTERASREARLVKQLDRMEMLLQALAYEQAGHCGMDEFWEGAEGWWSSEFPTVRALAMYLIDERKQLTRT